MRYWATLSRHKRPEINGRLVPIGVNPAGTSCHVLKAAGEVKVHHVTGGKELRVSMIAYELMENKNLYGPASLMDKTLIYPCEEYQCRVSCPCGMCRNKLGYCDDLEDHDIYHRANHSICRFCKELESVIPHFHHKIVYERVNNWNVMMTHIINFFDKLEGSSLFQHDYASARNPVKTDSLFQCENVKKNSKVSRTLKGMRCRFILARKKSVPIVVCKPREEAIWRLICCYCMEVKESLLTSVMIARRSLKRNRTLKGIQEILKQTVAFVLRCFAH